MSEVVCEVLSWRFLAGPCSTVRGPVEVDSDQAETLIENNQCYTMQEIADILKISKSIKLLVKMKTLPFILQKKTQWIFLPKPI